jgi:hypothetical protein
VGRAQTPGFTQGTQAVEGGVQIGLNEISGDGRVELGAAKWLVITRNPKDHIRYAGASGLLGQCMPNRTRLADVADDLEDIRLWEAIFECIETTR